MRGQLFRRGQPGGILPGADHDAGLCNQGVKGGRTMKEKSRAKKLTEKKFDINLLWIMSDTGKYIEIENNAQKIKKKM